MGKGDQPQVREEKEEEEEEEEEMSHINHRYAATEAAINKDTTSGLLFLQGPFSCQLLFLRLIFILKGRPALLVCVCVCGCGWVCFPP